MFRNVLFCSTAYLLFLCVSGDYSSWVNNVGSSLFPSGQKIYHGPYTPGYVEESPLHLQKVTSWHGSTPKYTWGSQLPSRLQPCNSSNPYRSADGSCNNLVHPTWGVAGTAYTRIAHPRYGDGISSMPVARSGHPLPNPRVLSTTLFPYRDISSWMFTHLDMQFGQFVTHDMGQLVPETDGGKTIECCAGTDLLPPGLRSDKCIPIPVPPHDPFYSVHGVRCISFVRSTTVPRHDLLQPADQVNSVSGYIDGSLIYGSDLATANALRTLSGGKLRTDIPYPGHKGFPPTPDDKSTLCPGSTASDPCYLTGDTRSNQSPPLALLHTLFLREHNRVASALASINPFWSDEKVYQEARRIVVAELQHITYQEWLPLNFGKDYYRQYGISPTSLFSRDYDPDVNPGVINSFSTAAFRHLHSMVPDAILKCPAARNGIQKYRLSDTFQIPRILEVTPQSFDDIVRGLLLNAASESDQFHTPEITNLLFKGNRTWGADLESFDVQRGRDHGLACYNDLREICGLRRAKTFQDLAEEIPQHLINVLANLYESVDDIDLMVGGSLETRVPGSVLGRTFQCIVAEQFYRSRIGDRFFYDHADMASSFTPSQLQQIKKCTMSRLICDNTDVRYIQKKAFEQESPVNPIVRCDDYQAIPFVDLTHWKQSAGFREYAV